MAARSLRTRTLRKQYADFSQPLTQDDTVQGWWMRSLRGYCYRTVSSRVSFAFDVYVKFTERYEWTPYRIDDWWVCWHEHYQGRAAHLTFTSSLYHVNNHINYAFIDPLWCHLGLMTMWSLRIVCAMSVYADAKRLYRFGQFNLSLDMKSLFPKEPISTFQSCEKIAIF